MPGKFSRNGGQLALLTVQPNAWLALCTTPPGVQLLGTEYAATGYARQLVPMGLPTETDPPTLTNPGQVTFGPFTANVGDTVTHAMLMAAQLGGTQANMIHFWELDLARTPAQGDTLVLDPGNLVIICDASPPLVAVRLEGA
jgi:hypothetical protein